MFRECRRLGELERVELAKFERIATSRDVLVQYTATYATAQEGMNSAWCSVEMCPI